MKLLSIIIFSINLLANNTFTFKEYKEIKTISDYNNTVNKTFKFMNDINKKLYHIDDDLYKNTYDKIDYTNISIFSKKTFTNGKIYNSIIKDNNSTITHINNDTQYYHLSYKDEKVVVYSNNDYTNKLYEFKYSKEYNISELNDMGKYSFVNNNSKAYEVLEYFGNDNLILYDDIKDNNTTFSSLDSLINKYKDTTLSNGIIKNRLTNKNLYFKNNNIIYIAQGTTEVVVGTYQKIKYNGVFTYKDSNGNIKKDLNKDLDVIVLNSTQEGITQNIALVLYKGSVKYAQYIKSNNAYSKLYYNISAMKEIYSNLSLNTNIKKQFLKGWTYSSIPTKMILCDNTIQTILSNICHQEYTLNSVFPSDKINIVLRNKNSKWTYWDSNLTINPRYKVNKFMALSSDDGLLIEAKKDTTISLPYDIFTNDDNFNFKINRTGWKLLTVNETQSLSTIEDKITLLGKKLTRLYVYRNDKWFKYIPSRNIKEMNDIKKYETFWVYTVLNHVPIILTPDNIDIYENTKDVLTINAFDNDKEDLTYSIVENNTAYFDINSSTGKITFKDVLQNDYEQRKSYDIKISASDGSTTTTKALHINILNKLEFNYSIEDNTTMGYRDIKFNRASLNQTVYYGNDDNKSYYFSGYDRWRGGDSYILKGIYVNKDRTAYFRYKTTRTTIPENSLKVENLDIIKNLTPSQKWQYVTIPLHKGINVFKITSRYSGVYVDDFKVYDSFSTNENSEIGKVLGNINIDEAYTVSLKNDYGKFKLNGDGTITTIANLDADEKNYYELELIKFSDKNSASNTKIDIYVNNLNDNIPVFDSNDINFTKNENDYFNTSISASDLDGDTLKYSIDSNYEDADLFEINQNEKKIYYIGKLDYELKPKVKVRVNVSDRNNTISKDITINIINNEAPILDSDENLTINENIQDIKLYAHDIENDTITYSLVQIDDYNYFTIDPVTGIIRFKNKNDYEIKKSYKVTINLADYENNVNQKIINISINNVVELEKDFISVVDGNISGTYIYDYNTVNNESKSIRLASTNCLIYDYDINQSMVLSNYWKNTYDSFWDARAYDHKFKFYIDDELEYQIRTSSWKQKLVILPKGKHTVKWCNFRAWPNYSQKSYLEELALFNTINIKEDASIGSIVGNINIQATEDINRSNLYLSGENNDTFLINENGSIILNKQLDRETKVLYSFYVNEKGENQKSNNNLIIINVLNVNEYAPIFSSDNNISIDENSNGIMISASDLDNDNLTYNIVGGVDKEMFDINSTSGELLFKTNPDYESKSKYEIVIQASDSNYTVEQNLSININDIQSIKFKNLDNMYVRDDTINLLEKIEVFNETNDSNLNFSLSKDDASYFNINASTGKLSFKKDVNFTSKSIYNITVDVNNTIINNSKDLQIKVNNARPIFTSDNNITVQEHSKMYFDVKVTDANNDILSYKLKDINDSKYFDINSTTGELSSKEELLYKTKAKYNITIEVNDGMYKTEQNLTVNMIDIIKIYENRQIVKPTKVEGNVIFKQDYIHTKYRSNIYYEYDLNKTKILYYDLMVGEYESWDDKPKLYFDNKYLRTFSGPEGEIGPYNSFFLELVKGIHTVKIYTGSGWWNSYKTYTKIKNAYYKDAIVIDDSLDINSTVANLSLDNNESNITLYGTNSDYFNIDKNGTISVAKKLDASKKDFYTLNILINNDNLTKSYNNVIFIKVNNITKIKPVFKNSNTNTVYENQEDAIRLEITGKSNKNLEYILVNDDAKDFIIDTTSSDTYDYIKFKNLPNYNQKNEYNLTVKVSNGIYIAEQNITVNIKKLANTDTVLLNIDENNNSDINISEFFDTNATNNVSYSINDNNNFSINSSTGALTFKYSPDYEKVNKYEFMVNQNSNEINSSKKLIININNIDEYIPVFDDDITLFKKNNLSEHFIGYIRASDDDNQKLYYFLSGNGSNKFNINLNTGELIINKFESLDFDKEYNFRVNVTDGYNVIYKDITVKTIKEYREYEYKYTDLTGTFIEDRLYQSIDRLTINNPINKIEYVLNNYNNYFKINKDKGIISVIKPLDYETQNIYDLNITLNDAESSRNIGFKIYVQNLIELEDNTTISLDMENTNFVKAGAHSEIYDDTLSENKIIFSYQNRCTELTNNTNNHLIVANLLAYERAYGVGIRTQLPSGEVFERFNINRGAPGSYHYMPYFVYLDAKNTNKYKLCTQVLYGTGTDNKVWFKIFDIKFKNVNKVIDEYMPIDSKLMTLKLDVNESNKNFANMELTGTNSDKFYIKTGAIYVKKELDYINKPIYKLFLNKKGEDLRTDKNAIIIIYDKSKNINLQEFTTTIGNISLAENSYYVTNATATDKDGDTLYYSLSGEDNESFNIGTFNGNIYSKELFDYDKKNNYKITVDVKDYRGNKISQDINISITNTDTNSNTWDFINMPRERYRYANAYYSKVYVNENTNFDINLSLINENNTSEFDYSIIGLEVNHGYGRDPGDSIYFTISNKGILSFNEMPDYEKRTSYFIKVTAKNESLNINKSKAVRIFINDTFDEIDNNDIGDNIIFANKLEYVVNTFNEIGTNVKYSIKENVDDADKFYMYNNKLVIKELPDIYIQDTYYVTLVIDNNKKKEEVELTIYMY